VFSVVKRVCVTVCFNCFQAWVLVSEPTKFTSFGWMFVCILLIWIAVRYQHIQFHPMFRQPYKSFSWSHASLFVKYEYLALKGERTSILDPGFFKVQVERCWTSIIRNTVTVRHPLCAGTHEIQRKSKTAQHDSFTLKSGNIVASLNSWLHNLLHQLITEVWSSTM
jgi:hypothetical protein